MTIINNFKVLNIQLSNAKKEGKIVGFVPTMGALHSGHSSLIQKCNAMCDVSVCSIFVNPLQFNNPEDFDCYPVTLDKDILLLEELGCTILFLPGVDEVYPDDKSKSNIYPLGHLESILEGKYRPGHFQGVCLVVERLLTMVNPDILFLGQKDYQQCLVIEFLIKLMNRNIRVIRCPTLREISGLAKSSRNLRLSEDQLQRAAELNKALNFIKNQAYKKHFIDLYLEAKTHLEEKGFIVEYLALANAGTLTLEEDFNKEEKQVILLAAYLNKIRLIDNVILE